MTFGTALGARVFCATMKGLLGLVLGAAGLVGFGSVAFLRGGAGVGVAVGGGLGQCSGAGAGAGAQYGGKRSSVGHCLGAVALAGALKTGTGMLRVVEGDRGSGLVLGVGDTCSPGVCHSSLTFSEASVLP